MCFLVYDGNSRRLNQKWFYGEPGNRTCDPFFCGFPWVETSTAGRVYDLCVYYITGAPEGSPKVVLCGFMIFFYVPATPGLQGIVFVPRLITAVDG